MRLPATIIAASALALPLWGQEPDTPTIRALNALVPMKERADQGKWIASQALRARISSADVLLAIRQEVNRPNYGGNAYAEIQQTLWLRVAKGETLTELLYAR